MEEKKLTPKERLFVEAYVTNGFNATQAAIDAKYSQKTAKEIGYENLTKPHIQHEINHILDEMRIKLQRKFITEAESAMKVMSAILNDSNTSNRDRLTAAKDILDRAGFKATERRELDVKGEIKHEGTRTLSERIDQYTKLYAELGSGKKESDHKGDHS